MEKRWSIKKQESTTEIAHLQQSMNIDQPLATLLLQRNIRSTDDANTFFNPDLKNLHDPFLMKDMEKAVVRIEQAIKNNEKIMVYGDYDVDGTTSVALMYSFLIGIYKNIDFYIPDRYLEGYGISTKGIDYSQEQGISLIVALDCGIKSAEKVRYAKEKGIDFIICDHHKPDDEIPEAAAVLDPKQPECSYPFKDLSGCGVGFKLMQAYAQKNNIAFEKLIPYLDLVIVSIASDIVPIIDENRILAHHGLQLLNNSPRMGLKAIIDVAGIEGKDIRVDDIVFKIGPRLNAAGRMQSGRNSVELLIAHDALSAQEKAKEINTFNNDRRNVDLSITDEALKQIASDESMKLRKTTVLFNPNWHKGVVGIVASRLTENYYRPTIVLTESNGFATGSARSVEGFDLYEAICKCSDLLENFGGHTYAAGLTVKVENIPALQQRFEEVVNDLIMPEQLIPKIEIDTELSLPIITSKFYKDLKRFEPFGPGNMSPIFFAENVVDNGNGRLVGNNKQHLKLSLVQEEKPFAVYQAIAFSQPQHFKHISSGKPFDIAFTITENVYMGQTTIQLNIKDIKY